MNNARYEFNLRQLLLIAEALGDLLPRVVFVGGCTTVLLVDDVAYSGVRQTEDVDVIVDLSTYLDYQEFSEALKKRGFVEDMSGPICRWLYSSGGATVQVNNLLNEDFLNVLPGLMSISTSPTPVLNILRIMASWTQS